MPDPINLTQLRAIATEAHLDNEPWYPAEDLGGYFGDEESAHIAACSPALALALIDTAEAAQEIAHIGHRLADDRSFKRLRDTLARFERP